MKLKYQKHLILNINPYCAVLCSIVLSKDCSSVFVIELAAFKWFSSLKWNRYLNDDNWACTILNKAEPLKIRDSMFIL